MAASSAPRKRTAKKSPTTPRPPAGAVSSIEDFRRPAGEEVLLPSGNVVVMKRPGMQKFLAMDLIPNTLKPIVDRAVRKGQGLKPVEEKVLMDKVISDPAQMQEMLDFMDRVTAACWVTPPVCYHRRQVEGEWQDIPEDERDLHSYVYTDEIDLDDKSFTFNYAVGGVRDLERFRQQLGSSVEHVRRGQNLEVSS